jgi:hypothetical protein
LIVGLEWKQVQKETEGQAKFGNSSFTVKKSENLAQHESTPGVIRHASDSCLTERDLSNGRGRQVLLHG